MNSSPRVRFDFILYYTSVCIISACSTVPWNSLKPAYVGACKFLSLAIVVSLRFIVAINSLAKGGFMAKLR